MRTTLDIDDVLLGELKERAAAERKSVGRLVSELLSPALKASPEGRTSEFVWQTTESATLVDIDDRDSLWRVLDAR